MDISHFPRHKSRRERLERVLGWIEEQLNKVSEHNNPRHDEIIYARKSRRRERFLRFKKWADGQLKKITEKDYLTAGEISKRDKFVVYILKIPFWRNLGLRANHVSIAGIILITLYNVLMSLGMPRTAFFYGALGVASDFIDGPMARWKNPKTGRDDVTGLGTILDHFRDFYYAISIGLDAFFRFGNINAVEITNAILILISYIIIITGVILKYQLLNLNYISPIFKKYSRARVKNAYRRFMDFSYMNLQTKLWGRAQFICLATGLTMLFLGKFMGINFLIGFSVDFFGATIAFGVLNFFQDYVMEKENDKNN